MIYKKHGKKFVSENIPGHISRAGNNLVVVKEAATWQVSIVSRQLTAHTNIAFSSF